MHYVDEFVIEALVSVFRFERPKPDRSHSGAKQIGDSDRGDDRYDGHDDQKLDQGKTAPAVVRSIRIVAFF